MWRGGPPNLHSSVCTKVLSWPLPILLVACGRGGSERSLIDYPVLLPSGEEERLPHLTRYTRPVKLHTSPLPYASLGNDKVTVQLGVMGSFLYLVNQ
ncbi:hypothetical protein NDU88_010515 [Pleurodeles waltl]|uniref:Uncharacterized protein n=1 Tax=Pleurodeles waltl TaxID=8319 RepID=A0AAV7PVD9_PLEWA|nr:hypothetical protein NDU88_010515 [Pleurodeles waltl]